MIGKWSNPALGWNGGENFRDWDRARKENETPEISCAESYSTQLTPEYH